MANILSIYYDVLGENFDNDIYDSHAWSAIKEFEPQESLKDAWWWTNKKLLNQVIDKALEQIKYALQDGNALESYDYAEQAAKQDWEEDIIDKDEYEDFDDYLQSSEFESYADEIVRIGWDDWNDNYKWLEDIAHNMSSYNKDWHGLSRTISELEGQVQDLPHEIEKIKITSKRETISYVFREEY